MEQGRRGGTQKNDASDAEIDSGISVLSSGGNEYRAKGGGAESKSGEYLDNSDHADGWDDAINVDRRTNHGARRRKWNIADNLRRDSGGVAEEHSDDLSIRTSGYDKLFQRGLIRGNRASDDSIRDICRGGVEANTDNVCQKGCRSACIWRTQQSFTAEGKSGGSDTDNICVECADVPDNGSAVYRQCDDTKVSGAPAMGHAVADEYICSADNILHVFLHGGNGEDPGYGGQSEKVRSVHTWDKTRATNGGLYRLRIDAAGDGGVAVLRIYRGITELDRRSDAHTRGILWRDGVINSGKCSVTHDETDRSDGRDAAL